MEYEEFGGENLEIDPSDWDEEDWEFFLERKELQALKYEELYETLQGDPLCERKVAEELGWGELIEPCVRENRRCDECLDRSFCQPKLSVPVSSSSEALYNSYEQIPAFKSARKFFCLVKKHFGAEGKTPEERRLLQAASLPPAMIASGHGLGYGRSTLCGNIALCKRALIRVEEALEILEEAYFLSALSPSELSKLFASAEHLYMALEEWIEVLRGRKWWH